MNMLQFSLHMKSCILIFFNRESHCNWLTTRVFCKKKTKQAQHDCLLLRNLAMLGASEDLQDRPVHSTPDRLLSCPHCARTFLTQNGLQMHLQKTHAVDCKGSIYPVQQPAHIVVKHSSARAQLKDTFVGASVLNFILIFQFAPCFHPMIAYVNW